jgi:hypothetical protein
MSNNTFCSQQSFNGINPLSRKFIHKNIHLNTKFRDDYFNTSSTKFKYTFSESLENVVSIKLTSLSLPNSWYLFSEERGNNKFYIKEEEDTTSDTYTLDNAFTTAAGRSITITAPGPIIVGDGSTQSLAQLATAFNTATATGGTLANHNNFAGAFMKEGDINGNNPETKFTIIRSNSKGFTNDLVNLTAIGGTYDGTNAHTFTREDKVKGCSMHEIVIKDGTYSAAELVTYLNSKYFNDSGTTTTLQYLKFNIDTNSKRSSFELLDNRLSTGKPKFTISFVNEQTENIMFTAGWILGFRHGKYINMNSYILSEGLYDSYGDRYLYFCLKDYNNNVSNSNLVFFDDTTMRNDVLGKIYLKDRVKHTMHALDESDYFDNSRIREYFGPVSFKKLEIQLLDEFGRQIKYNNI